MLGSHNEFLSSPSLFFYTFSSSPFILTLVIIIMISSHFSHISLHKRVCFIQDTHTEQPSREAVLIFFVQAFDGNLCVDLKSTTSSSSFHDVISLESVQEDDDKQWSHLSFSSSISELSSFELSLMFSTKTQIVLHLFFLGETQAYYPSSGQQAVPIGYTSSPYTTAGANSPPNNSQQQAQQLH